MFDTEETQILFVKQWAIEKAIEINKMSGFHSNIREITRIAKIIEDYVIGNDANEKGE